MSAGFDWSREADAASLWISVYDVELQRVFTSIGGMDMTQAIDTRSSRGRLGATHIGAAFSGLGDLDSASAGVPGTNVELQFHPI